MSQINNRLQSTPYIYYLKVEFFNFQASVLNILHENDGLFVYTVSQGPHKDDNVTEIGRNLKGRGRIRTQIGPFSDLQKKHINRCKISPGILSCYFKTILDVIG